MMKKILNERPNYEDYTCWNFGILISL